MVMEFDQGICAQQAWDLDQENRMMRGKEFVLAMNFGQEIYVEWA